MMMAFNPAPQINSALQTALQAQMQQEVASGQARPMTSNFTPTVFGKLMENISAPSIPQVAQQAGLAGQIENMRRQQMMQAMQQMAARQMQGNPMDQGIAAAPGADAVRMAEGGIVGYAQAGTAIDPDEARYRAEQMEMDAGTRADYSKDTKNYFARINAEQQAAEQAQSARLREQELARGRATYQTQGAASGAPAAGVAQEQKPTDQDFRRRMDEERARNMAIIANEGYTRGDIRFPQTTQETAAPPAAPPKAAPTGAPAAAKPTGVEALFERERRELGGIKTTPATMAEIAAKYAQEDPAYRQLLISQGIDPDALIKRIAEDKALFESQRELLRKRMEREEGKDTFLSRIGEAARGFRQLKGQGIGAGLLSSEEALSRRVGAAEAAMDQMRDAEIKINELEITRRRALEDQRRAVFEGRLDKVAAAEATRQNAENEIKRLQALTYGKQATAMLEERKIAQTATGQTLSQQAQEFARLQGIAGAQENRKTIELRKLDEDFAKQNAMLLNAEKFGGLKPEQKKELDNARLVHEQNKSDIAKQYDARINMINARLYPGVDFSSKSSSGAGSADIEAARKIVSGGK